MHEDRHLRGTWLVRDQETMSHNLSGRRKRCYIHYLAQRTPDPLEACFRRAGRQTKRRAEWVEPVNIVISGSRCRGPIGWI